MQKLTVLQHKLTTKKADQTTEPDEFLIMYDKVLEIRHVVKDVESAIGSYMKTASALSKTAKKVGDVLETDPMTQVCYYIITLCLYFHFHIYSFLFLFFYLSFLILLEIIRFFF